MQVDQALRFDPFRLDPRNARLWRGRRLIALTPKAFAVLCHLVEHAGQLVTKDALLTTVWPEIYVSEGVLSECVREIRKALGDSPQAPRFIQTVHRRGYRFIARVVRSQYSVGSKRRAASDSQLATGNWQLTTSLVGREAELQQLRGWLEKALRGSRQLVFITGEAGIGKTTVVDAFVARLSAKSNVWIGRGQCIDHYGQGEAYLPVLEALGRMCREPEGKPLIDLLSQHAPTGLVQMPALLTTTDLEALQRRTHGATRERMLRELAEALEVLTTERPLVLWLEDLQWSDVSTLDWLAFVARRREPARLLIIGAYRPVEVIVSNHPLKSVKQELQLHGQCDELPLSFLTEEHVAKYLVRRFAVGATHASPLRRLAQLIHQRTEGNPLFMVNLVDYLIAQGVLARLEGQWRLQGEVTAVESWAPESVQQMIEKQIERLSPAEKRVLEVASVAGAEFSAAAVAAGAGIAVEAVEEHCRELARHEQFLRARGTAEWPDGAVAARYGFLHALYQDVLYGRLTARQQQRLHQQIGERVEQAYGERAREIAAELALHFEQGRDYGRAVQYLEHAGTNALRRSAHQEAVTLLTRGLELLKTLPDTPERTQQELAVQMSLGLALMTIKGYAAPEVEQAYARAHELCQQVGDSPQLFPVLLGLVTLYVVRARFQSAREIAEHCLALAQHEKDPALLLEAHRALGQVLLPMGELALARTHLEQGLAFYDPRQHHSHAFLYGHDPGIFYLTYLAGVLWHLGYPDQALKRDHKALTLAQELGHPFTLAAALGTSAMFYQYRREEQLMQEQIEANQKISGEHGFALYMMMGTFLQAWALTEHRQVDKGITQIQQCLTTVRALGVELLLPYWLLLLAEAHGKGGQPEEGLRVLAEALAMVDKNGERRWEAELYRLKGTLTLQQFQVSSSRFQVQENQKSKGKGQRAKITNSQSPTPNPQAEAEAEACFLKAIEVARRQSAKSWELRATVSLTRVWQSQGKRKEAHKLLSEIYDWFTEGFDTKDLQEAKALLGELQR